MKLLIRLKSLLCKDSFPPRPVSRPPHEQELKEAYYDQGLDRTPDSFVLYRIIGNDLPPRHAKGQSRNNISFILENEAAFEQCEKRWVVNRIIDQGEEKKIIDLLEQYHQTYIHLPFDAKEYARSGWAMETFPSPDFFESSHFARLSPDAKLRAQAQTYRHKNNAVMHTNPARNAALRQGKTVAKWVLPWDGNCFLTRTAWREIVGAIAARPYLKYFLVPMTRVPNNQQLLDPDFQPEPNQEPQIIFRFDAKEAFNEEFAYGRRPKVELFWRLGVPGEWELWESDPWDLPFPEHSPEAGQFGFAGWVARLFSGNAEMEENNQSSFVKRGPARDTSIIAMLDSIDRTITNSDSANHA